MLRTLVALATTVAFLVAGCAGDRPWPAYPVAISTGSFATRGEIATIDVLPLDLQLWAEPGYEDNLAGVRAGSEVNIMNTALGMLSERDYTVGATIDWNGDFSGGNALRREDLIATVGALAHYGAATAQHPGQLPVPFLPARLGTTTGSDATLYVGGWGYVTKDHDSTGETVAKVLVIGLIVIAVIAVIAAVTSKSKSSHGRGHHRGGADAAGVASGGGSAGGRAVSHGGTHGGFTASRGTAHIQHGRRAAFGLVDAFGRAAVDIALSSPDWAADPELPRNGGESRMYLEMTLVDNRTGLAVWHAHQTFPANANSAEETARAARTMLLLLPNRASPPRTAAN